MQVRERKIQLIRYGMLCGCVIFYLIWLFVDGITIAVDTASYVSFDVTREPFYPLLLAFFRTIFGEQQYFWWVGAAQCILTGYVTWRVSDTLADRLHLDLFSLSVVTGLQLAVNLMTRLVAGRKTFYCLAMETEGIAIPLFLLFFIHLYTFLLEYSKKELLIVYTYALVLVLIRKQMFITLVILGVIWSFGFFLKKIKWKKFLTYICLLVLVFVLSGLVERMYNYSIRGRAMERTTDVTMLITSLFVAQPEDADAIEDASLREVFLEMLREIEEQQWGIKHAPQDMLGLQEFYANNYDNISYKVLKPFIRNYVSEQVGEDFVEISLAFDKQVSALQRCTALQNIGVKVRLVSANAFCGLMNTVAKTNNIFVGYTIIVLGFFVMLLFVSHRSGYREEVLLGGLTLVCIIVNVGVVSLMIFTQSRYMIYNMPMFYIALFLSARKLILNKRKGLEVKRNG